jgi:hypothetical protein
MKILRIRQYCRVDPIRGALPARPIRRIPNASCNERLHALEAEADVPEFASPPRMDHTSHDESEALNLTTRRGATSVWDRRGWDGTRPWPTVTRLLVGAGGGALAIQAFRQGTWKGRVLGTMGSTLAVWALTGEGDLSAARRWFNEIVERSPWGTEDRVGQESAESFPASDAPSWTPTVGTGLRRRPARH